MRGTGIHPCRRSPDCDRNTPGKHKDWETAIKKITATVLGALLVAAAIGTAGPAQATSALDRPDTTHADDLGINSGGVDLGDLTIDVGLPGSDAPAVSRVKARADPGNLNPGVFPPSSHPSGMTYAQWSVIWWKWAFLQPAAISALNDPTGARCAVLQSGPVWFLAGAMGSAERTCTVPRGKAILFPVINGWCSIPFDGKTLSEITSCAKAQMDGVILKEASVDGVQLQNLDAYRFRSSPFLLPAVPTNYFGYDPGIYPSVADGFWIMLYPLSRGEHTLHLRGCYVACSNTADPPTFESNVTYHLRVR
ncbi:hypothetical protein [Frankia sp. Cas3]|uniref:hypothetical protein n=1 Tax=Frankia sp. Cas3 TaxID=3073926 RepID=UPI002AD40E3D|nr:hypothetical protein [Frankia sp. Cas3]